jgi:hypothetical protein
MIQRSFHSLLLTQNRRRTPKLPKDPFSRLGHSVGDWPEGYDEYSSGSATRSRFVHCCSPKIDAELQNSCKFQFVVLAIPLAIRETTICNQLMATPKQLMIRLSLAGHQNTSCPRLVASRASRASSSEPEHRRHAATEAPRTTRLLGAVTRTTIVPIVDAAGARRPVLFSAAVVGPGATRAVTTGRGTNEVVVAVAQAAAHEPEAAQAVGEVFSVPGGASGSQLVDLGCYDVVSNDLVSK